MIETLPNEWKPKVYIAQEKLHTAIMLHLNDDCPYSAHSLACDAAEILDAVRRTLGQISFGDLTVDETKRHTIKRYWDARNLYRNTFKHAKDPDLETIRRFDEISTDYVLYVAIHDYMGLMGKSPAEFQVIQLWFAALHEDRIDPTSPVVAGLNKVFPNIKTADRLIQKQVALTKIKEVKGDKKLSADPRTGQLSVEDTGIA